MPGLVLDVRLHDGRSHGGLDWAPSASRQLYELRDYGAESSVAPWPLAGASVLVVRLRDRAVARLSGALPARKADSERVLIGRKSAGSRIEHECQVLMGCGAPHPPPTSAEIEPSFPPQADLKGEVRPERWATSFIVHQSSFIIHPCRSKSVQTCTGCGLGGLRRRARRQADRWRPVCTGAPVDA